MSRIIDRIVVTSLLAGALYMFFMGALHSIPLAAASAFIAMACLKKLASRFPNMRINQKKRARDAARHELEKLALDPSDLARQRAIDQIREAYPDEAGDIDFIFIQRYPSGMPLSVDDVLAEWKRDRGNAKAVIITPVKATEQAFTLAASLDEPKIRLIDGPRLQSIIAAHFTGEIEPSKLSKRGVSRVFNAIMRAAKRAHVGKLAISGAMLTLLFMLTGATVYLATALILFFIAGISLKRRVHPRALFDQ